MHLLSGMFSCASLGIQAFLFILAFNITGKLSTFFPHLPLGFYWSPSLPEWFFGEFSPQTDFESLSHIFVLSVQLPEKMSPALTAYLPMPKKGGCPWYFYQFVFPIFRKIHYGDCGISIFLGILGKRKGRHPMITAGPGSEGRKKWKGHTFLIILCLRILATIKNTIFHLFYILMRFSAIRCH